MQEESIPRWAGREVRRLGTVDSTNRAARQWAREGAAHGAAVVAANQTAGRGRRGRTWASLPGAGLWLSIVLRPALTEAAWMHLPFAAGLAVADACQGAAGVPVDLKWPNDLVISGRKVCGMLIEREGDAAVLGIGINVRQRPEDFPEELRGKAASLQMAAGHEVDMDALESELYATLEKRVDQLQAEDEEALLEEYAGRCVTIGAQVTVQAAEDAFEGIAEGLDGTGALLVRDGMGAIRRVLAGDVSVRARTGYA